MTPEEKVHSCTPGTTARYDALRLWALRNRINPAGLSADELEAMFAGSAAEPNAAVVPVPSGLDADAVRRIVEGMRFATWDAHNILSDSLNAALGALSGEVDELRARRPLSREDVEAIARQYAEPRVQVLVQRANGTLVPPAQTGEHLHPVFPQVFRAARAGKHVFLSGPAGSGKTTLAKQVANALERPFYAMGAVKNFATLWGYTLAGVYYPSPFYDAFTKGGVLLLDEVDGSDENLLLDVNQALANRVATFPGSTEPVEAHPDFVAVAAANTIGQGASLQYLGRNALDGATLNRFRFIACPYDEAAERAIADSRGVPPEWTAHVQALRKAAASIPGCRLIVSPRATYDGGELVAELLAEGVARKAAFEEAEEGHVWQGCPASLRDQVRGAM
mgnify:CR=1 FL=1